MVSRNTRVAAADMEAAAWHARLGERPVSTRTIEEFFAWRAAPANADAWRRVQAVWEGSGRLGGEARIQAAVDQALTRRGRNAGRRRQARIIGLIGGAAAALVLGVGVWAWVDSRSLFVTEVGEQQLVQLDDGSTVRLDTASAVRVRMSGRERRVVLERGQALFTVARDALRPFVVAAGGAEVTAVGTVFDVRRQGEAVRVTLVEGAVDVASKTGRAGERMQAGEQAQVTADGVRRRAVDTAQATSWIEGRLVFEDVPLRQAAAEMNRYLQDPIVIEAGAAGETPVSGVFRAGDRAAFASAAAAGLGLQSRVRPDGSLVLSAREKNLR